MALNAALSGSASAATRIVHPQPELQPATTVSGQEMGMLGDLGRVELSTLALIIKESVGLPAASAGTSPTLREVKRRLARRPEVDLSEASSAELRAIVRQAALDGISPLVV